MWKFHLSMLNFNSTKNIFTLKKGKKVLTPLLSTPPKNLDFLKVSSLIKNLRPILFKSRGNKGDFPVYESILSQRLEFCLSNSLRDFYPRFSFPIKVFAPFLFESRESREGEKSSPLFFVYGLWKVFFAVKKPSPYFLQIKGKKSLPLFCLMNN